MTVNKLRRAFHLHIMRRIFCLIPALTFFLPFYAALTDWKLHPIFDEEVSHVVDTPDYVYFTSRNMEENSNNATFFSLFRYDKKGEELQSLSKSNYLNGNNITDLIYNPAGGYIALLYDDYNIDLVHNNGKVSNIPYYSGASLSHPKKVNSITVDEGENRIYLATDFGYVAINGKKNEIAESRIYGEPLEAFCRLGNEYLLLKGNELLSAPVSKPRLNLDEYVTVANLEKARNIYPLNDNECVMIIGDPWYSFVVKLTRNEGEYNMVNMFEGFIHNIENTAQGLVLATDDNIYRIDRSGNMSSLERPDGFKGSAATTSDMSDVWVGKKRQGLAGLRNNGEGWSITRDWMIPNEPSTYATTSFINHPEKGFMMLGTGNTPATTMIYSFAPWQLSAKKNGRWENLSTSYTLPERGNMLTATTGMAVDPDNSKYIYITSYHNGILRMNVDNPTDFIHMSLSHDEDAGKEGFVEFGVPQNKSKRYWNISAPHFDKYGNLWMNYANWDDASDPNPHFYCWTSDDRKATSNWQDVKLPVEVEFDIKIPTSNAAQSLPLLKSGSGLIVYVASVYNDELVLLDFNGTPTDTSDDKIYKFTSFVDSDGNNIEIRDTKYLWEDPVTGYVWLCHDEGVCYFIPSQVIAGDYRLYRPKVSRNDGTNLADYLLSGVTVNYVTSDSEGRKWFATQGGGIVGTSADGREIIEEFTTANSLIPSDVVFAVGYDEVSNSLMVSTDKGYGEYYLPAKSQGEVKTSVRAYPNPVRPEFSGYVTITDIPQGSFVKITDVAGNLVKDLGVMTGFEMLWDISDANYNRVRSGVYHIMVSPSDETSSYKAVGKILVVS